MDKSLKLYWESPVGWLEIGGSEAGIQWIAFVDKPGVEEAVPKCLVDCRQQLMEYFAGKRKTFDLPLLPEGTPFQQSVWAELRKIPFGKTVAYRDIAAAVGNPDACRAVGAANGRNRINIVIPCHRVIGSSGRLTGYGGGLWRKERLLKHEEEHS